MSDWDVVVVGGGIVGLATAFRLLEARPGTRLLLLEKETTVAAHQTGRNSGVIHSGIYYKPGGLKARNCREGYRQLLDFCRDHGIAHELCGKIIVATRPDELPRLEELHRRGVANGLEGLRWLDAAQIREIEPHVTGIRGLQVPQTGIVDYVGMSEKLADLIRQRGGEIHLGERVAKIARGSNSSEVVADRGTYRARAIVTCAGLQSDRLARNTHPDLPMRIVPFRGEYYELTPDAHHLVKHLIYPVPDPAFPFLGVHFTRMVKGGIEAGPNAVLAFGREAYRKTDFNFTDTRETFAWPGFRKVARKYWRTGLGEFHRSWSKAAFVTALQRLIPEVRAEHLVPGSAGIRAQACQRDGALVDDFYILEDQDVIHVCNAPSPAATASLAIGGHIAGHVLPHLS
jgi:L-2-hydroxyglutarate oxidase